MPLFSLLSLKSTHPFVGLNCIEHKAKDFNIRLAASDAVLKFTSGMDIVNYPLADGERFDSAIEVLCASLDSLLKGAAPALVKTDLESDETCVLDGSRQTLESAALHSVIMELYGSGERYGLGEKRLFWRMLGLGFKTYSYDPLGRKLLNLNGKNHEQGNTFFIRNEALIRQRLATAPTVDVRSMSF